MSRGLHPRECDALNMLDAGESIGVVAQLCRLTVGHCLALAHRCASRSYAYQAIDSALRGREMFDDELTSGAWWVQ